MDVFKNMRPQHYYVCFKEPNAIRIFSPWHVEESLPLSFIGLPYNTN